jgi:hypothetical protein
VSSARAHGDDLDHHGHCQLGTLELTESTGRMQSVERHGLLALVAGSGAHEDEHKREIPC